MLNLSLKNGISPIAARGASAGGGGGDAFWFAPTSRGAADGTSYADAAAITSLATIVNANGGGTYNILADEGNYSLTGSGQIASITVAGTAENPIIIRGVNANETPAKATFVGTRTEWTLPADPETVTDTRAWTDSERDGFYLNDNSAYITFRDLRFERMGGHTNSSAVSSGGNAIIYSFGTADHITIEDCEGYNIRRFVDGSTSSHGFSNLVIDGLTVIGFSKQCIRLRGASTGTIKNVNLNSGRQDGDRFAVGIQIEGSAHDITIEGSDTPGQYGIIENCHDSITGAYWNADGIACEEEQYNITIRRCHLRGHTDGGLDIKPMYGTLVDDCIIEDNKRNVRIWNSKSEPVIIQNSIIRLPNRRGGSSGPSQIYLSGSFVTTVPGPALHVKNSTISGTGKSAGVTGSMAFLYEVDNYNSHLRIIDCTVTNTDAAANYIFDGATSTIATGSAVSDTTPPTIYNPGTLQLYVNETPAWHLAADEAVYWRIAGTDQASFGLTADVLTMTASATAVARSISLVAYDNAGNATTLPLAVTVSDPISAGYDADASAIFATMTGAPTDARKSRIHATVSAMKAVSGLWAKLGMLQVYAAHDAQGGLVDWKTRVVATAVNSPTHTTDRGYAGNGTTSYVDTGYNPSGGGGGYAQNDAMAGIWSLTSAQVAASSAGWFDGTDGTTIQPRNSSNQAVYRINHATGTTITSQTLGNGFYIAQRTGASATTLHRFAVLLNSGTAASTAVNSANLRFGSITAASFATTQGAAMFAGASLSDQQRLGFYRELRNYLAILGAV
jgi:hypothetical protein